MSLTPPLKSTNVQAYNLAIYRSALHPEFFDIESRMQLSHGEYEFEAWVFRGGHMLRFEMGGQCISEIVGDCLDGLPARGHVTTLPCAGERDHEASFGESVVFMTSIQTETLSGHLYLGTYGEMLDHGRESGSLLSTWSDQSQSNLSLVDVQRYSDEVHVQAYHLRADAGLVLRTQTIFQISTD